MAPGETIKTDACTNCTCEELATGPESHCMVEACESRKEDKDYVMQEIVNPDACCSKFVKSACKVGEMVYEVSFIFLTFARGRSTVFMGGVGYSKKYSTK